MEFEDEHNEDHELEEEDDEDEDDGEEITIPPPPPPLPQPPQPSYDSAGRPISSGSTRSRPNSERRSGAARYRECLKNHAVNIGGHALDGCGEFMPSGEEGSLDALRCAACNCHRNFHRREVTEGPQQSPSSGAGGACYPAPQVYGTPPPGYIQVPPQHRPLTAAMPSTSGGTHSGEIDDSGGGGVMKKRFRTKFTQEQKDKMLAFAEKLGWRIQKHDEAAVQQFCAEVQIKRQVLKVWMHNNKNTLGKKQP